MAYEMSIIKLTPVDGYITNSIGNSDVYIIDCSDLGELGLYTYADSWIASVKAIITTYSSSVPGVSVLYGHIYRTLSVTNQESITYETTCSVIDNITLVPYGNDVAVRLSITSGTTLRHAIFIECNVQKIGG